MFNRKISSNGISQFQIPRDRRENCTYVMIGTQNIVNYLNLFKSESSTSKRKQDELNFCLKPSHAKRKPTASNYCDENFVNDIPFDELAMF